MIGFKRTVSFVLLVCSILFWLSDFVYAGVAVSQTELVLSCADKVPMVIEIKGIPKVTQEVTMKAMKFKGNKTMITKIPGDVGFDTWCKSMEIFIPPQDEESLKVLKKAGEISSYVDARCPGDSDKFGSRLWPPGAKMECGEGEDIKIEVYKPNCEEQPDQQAVVLLTRKINDETSRVGSEVYSKYDVKSSEPAYKIRKPDIFGDAVYVEGGNSEASSSSGPWNSLFQKAMVSGSRDGTNDLKVSDIFQGVSI